MFTLLSFRHGLKTSERDLNRLTDLSTLYVCHIFLVTTIICFMKWAGVQLAWEDFSYYFIWNTCLISNVQKSKSIQNDLNISEV